ncbi:stage II sporulation protein M [Candidatus Woesearchaeota archaeon]|nr:stage II sporulation protein M [Candidatus Woesearchaeota archaeon]
MVIESLISPLKAEAKPLKMMLFGFIYTSIAIFLGWWIFKEQSSLVFVFLTTMAAVPLMYNTIKLEEKKDCMNLPEKTLLREHGRALALFMNLFVGVTLACTVWYTFLPNNIISFLFKIQSDTIIQINSTVTGFSIRNFEIFTKILSNNLKVLIFCVLFSFLYGVGAIFILTWNASVIGVAIGNFIRSEFYKISSSLGFTYLTNYFHIVSIGLFRYAIHGIPEILSYFTAGLAGGIISTAVIKHDFGTKAYEKIVMDSSLLLLLSFFLIVTAAFLEVFVTPVLF